MYIKEPGFWFPKYKSGEERLPLVHDIITHEKTVSLSNVVSSRYSPTRFLPFLIESDVNVNPISHRVASLQHVETKRFAKLPPYCSYWDIELPGLTWTKPFSVFSHASDSTNGSVVVSPPLCFRLKCLNKCCMDCHENCSRHSWSSEDDLAQTFPLASSFTFVVLSLDNYWMHCPNACWPTFMFLSGWTVITLVISSLFLCSAVIRWNV